MTANGMRQGRGAFPVSALGGTVALMHALQAWRWPFYLAGGVAIITHC